MRPERAVAGEKLYSTAAGPAGAMGISLGLLLAACALQAGVVLAEDRGAGVRSALFLAPLALTVCGAAKLATTRDRRYAPDGLPLLGYVVFLAVCAGQWLVRQA